MEITDVQVKLVGNGDDRLKASCTIVIDGEFVVRDVKVIEGTNGLFVAMPSRKLTDHCPKCRHKNHLRSRYCNHCGTRLAESRWQDKMGVTQLHAEISHPINSDCRERLHKRVIAAYEEALARHADKPGGDRSFGRTCAEDDAEDHSDGIEEISNTVPGRFEAANRRPAPAAGRADGLGGGDETLRAVSPRGAYGSASLEGQVRPPGQPDSGPADGFGAGLD